MCFDSNHLLQEKPEEFVAKTGALITTVHISDYDGVDEKHWLPGKGIIDWTNVIRELAGIEFEGPFMYEVVRKDSDNPPPTTKDLVYTWKKLRTDYLNEIRE